MVFLLLPSLSRGEEVKPNLRFSQCVRSQFPNLEKVLSQLLKTLMTPGVWGQNILDKKVLVTRTFSNVRLKNIHKEFIRYLTDGSLEIHLRPDPKGGRLRAAGNTPNKNKINLMLKAGSWKNRNAKYSDYQLAMTIYHELMHIWQHRNWWISGEYVPFVPWDKEAAPYFIENLLPKKHFDAHEYYRPFGPSMLGVWRTDSRKYFRFSPQRGNRRIFAGYRVFQVWGGKCTRINRGPLWYRNLKLTNYGKDCSLVYSGEIISKKNWKSIKFKVSGKTMGDSRGKSWQFVCAHK